MARGQPFEYLCNRLIKLQSDACLDGVLVIATGTVKTALTSKLSSRYHWPLSHFIRNGTCLEQFVKA